GAGLREGARVRDEVGRVLRLVELEPRADVPASALTVQEKKRLEFARALATGARFLLLDELFAGLSPEEVRASIEVLRRVPAVLRLEAIDAGYDGTRVLWDVGIEAKADATTVIVGPNGAGKSTVLNVVTGLLRPSGGHVLFKGEDITQVPAHARPERGIAACPEGRRLFPQLTAEANLRLGAYTRRARKDADATLARVYELFPRIRQRARVKASRLSGGEQQMVGIGRALMA